MIISGANILTPGNSDGILIKPHFARVFKWSNFAPPAGASPQIKEGKIVQAVIEACGKQYKVSEGDVIFLEKLGVEADESVTFDKVVAILDGENSSFGVPAISGASVTAKVLKNGKSKKIIVFKYKSKKNYRRRQGHRQPYTKVQIEKISVK